MNGTVAIRRARYQCSVTGRLYCPLDSALDLPPGDVTVSLARRSLRLATFTSVAALQEELRVQHGVSLSDSTLNLLMQAAGSTAEQDRQDVIDELRSLPMGLHRERVVVRPLLDVVPRRLYVSCDGVTYRTRYREHDRENKAENRLIYQEMKVGAVFWQDRDDQWHKRVMAGRDDPERFGLSLWHLAVQCGMLEASEVIFISDGGGWCHSVAETYFRDAIRILDWYHLSEHVWEAARLLYPSDEKAVRRWARTCLSHLHDSSGIGLLRHLERSRRLRPVSEQAVLDPLLGYLRPRLAITDYVDYRARHASSLSASG